MTNAPKPTPPVPEEQLLRMLSDLLAEGEANGGQLSEDSFWRVVAAIAQGRGITERLHAEGLEAANKTPRSPAITFNERQRRAYHIQLMAQLLLGVGGLPDRASILPANFIHAAVIDDLLQLLAGPGGKGGSTPVILTTGRQGEAAQRRHARRRLVGVVLWRVGNTNETQDVNRRAKLTP